MQTQHAAQPGSLAAPSDSGRILHTPGPWKAIQGMDEDDVERWSVVADNGTRPYLIATIENGQPGDCCATEGATAALIAAAPDLLEMLERLLPAIPANAIDRQAALSKPVSDCFINTMVRRLIERARGQNAEPSQGAA